MTNRLTRRDFIWPILAAGVVVPVTVALAWQAPNMRNDHGDGSMGGGMMQGGGPMGGMMGDADTPNVTSDLDVPRFRSPLRRPAILEPTRTDDTTDYYEMTMQPADVEIVPGLRTRVWGFNGQVPGPTIRAQRGRRVVVRQTNDLPEPTSTHLHGGHVAPEHDGHPTDLVEPGEAREYVYPNDQRSATLWYHDHAMDATAPHVYKGLAGLYLLTDPEEDGLGLPSGEYDVPLLIQDRAFEHDGALKYPGSGSMPLLMNGFLGDTLLVNGTPYPYFEVGTHKYRLRLLNGSNARRYTLALSGGISFTLLANDGGLLPAPIEVETIELSPAERAEVIVDFSDIVVGESVTLENRRGDGLLREILRFDVAREEIDDTTVPDTLRPIENLDPESASQEREWTLNMQMGPSMMFGGSSWMIDGESFDPDRIDAHPEMDSVEVWRFTNPSNMPHPMHIHLAMFQVLDRDGEAPLPTERGWKDTVTVGSGETVRVITRFTGYRGEYIFHCHNLEHEDHGMMATFRVE